MNRKEIAEIKKQFTPENCSITRICGCYVDGDKNKKTKLKEAFLSLPDEETFKYFNIFKKTLSGRLGKNLMNLDFPLEQEKEGGTQEFLMKLRTSLRTSKLKGNELLDEFYDKVIENYDYPENYYIILIHAVYDIPGKASDGIEMDDASDEIYEHILCSICPVSLSKPGLSYDTEKNNIKDRIRDWVVGVPDVGFLFPAFNDRSTDIHSVLYYNKSVKNIHDDFVKNVLGTFIPMASEDEKECFLEFVNMEFDTYRNFDFAENLVEALEDLKELKKDNPDATTIFSEDARLIFENCGLPDSEMKEFEENWVDYFGEAPLTLDNIHNSKTAKIITPDATICISPDRIKLVELQEVNGVPSLVIPINGQLEVNGIEISLRGDDGHDEFSE